MNVLFRYRRQRIAAAVAVFALLLAPMRLWAIGISPPEVDLGYVPAGTTNTVSVNISRSPEEMEGSMLLTVTPRKSAADFFVGETSIIIPAGIRSYKYLFTVAPTYAAQEAQELYVTLLVTPTSLSETGVSVITGATQVVRFTTDRDASAESTTNLTVTPILGGVSAGATCEAFRTDTGEVLGTALTDSSGTCTVILPRSYTGVVVVRVKGGPGVKYFDERTGQLADFSANQAVVSVVAPSVWNTPKATVSTPVTTLTTVVAAKAGVSTSATAATVSAPTITEAAITQAVEETLPIFGLSSADINVFETPAPTAFFRASDAGTEKKLSGSSSQLSYGVALKAVADIAPSGTQLADFAQTLATAAAQNNVAEIVPTIANFQTAFQQAVTTSVAETATVTATVSAPATVAGKPIGASASAGVGQALVSFTAPASNGGTAITSYFATCTSSSGSTASASGTTSPITVSGLNNGETYSCTVRARNAIGSGAWSDTVSVVPSFPSGGGTSQGSRSSGGDTSTRAPVSAPESPRSTTPKETTDKGAPPADSRSTQKPPAQSETPLPSSDATPGGEPFAEPSAPSSDQAAPQVQESRPWWQFWAPSTPSGEPTAPSSPRESAQPTAPAPDASGEPSADEDAAAPRGTAGEDIGPAPVSRIQSPTHPSQDAFVPSGDVTFHVRPTGPGTDTPTRWALTTEPTVEPSQLTQETDAPSVSFRLPDGIYYLHTQDALDASAPVETRRVMIDTTPPSIDVAAPAAPRLPFFPVKKTVAIASQDALAGVAEVRASVDGKGVEVKSGEVSTRGLGWGEHTLTVDATDEAGNVIIQQFTLKVEPKYPVVHTVSRALAWFNPLRWFR